MKTNRNKGGIGVFGFSAKNIRLYAFQALRDAWKTWLTNFQKNLKSSLTLLAFFPRPKKIYHWIYFRMVVEADCVNEIKNCVGHLIKIEKDGAIIYDHDVRRLPFAPAENPDCIDKTIFPNIPYPLDVLAVYTPNLTVLFATKGQPTQALNQNGVYIFKEDGEYILYQLVRLLQGFADRGIPFALIRELTVKAASSVHPRNGKWPIELAMEGEQSGGRIIFCGGHKIKSRCRPKAAKTMTVPARRQFPPETINHGWVLHLHPQLDFHQHSFLRKKKH